VHNENFGRKQNEQLSIVVKNFPEYVSARLSDMPEWPEIQKLMNHFVAVWVTGHMAFLHQYKDSNKDENKASLFAAENEVFKNDFMKSYKLKYFLKKNLPIVHDSMVKLKKGFKKDL